VVSRRGTDGVEVMEMVGWQSNVITRRRAILLAYTEAAVVTPKALNIVAQGCSRWRTTLGYGVVMMGTLKALHNRASCIVVYRLQRKDRGGVGDPG
jgi:hypothetical protein